MKEALSHRRENLKSYILINDLPPITAMERSGIDGGNNGIRDFALSSLGAFPLYNSLACVAVNSRVNTVAKGHRGTISRALKTRRWPNTVLALGAWRGATARAWPLARERCMCCP
jgi:hypothetical protein